MKNNEIKEAAAVMGRKGGRVKSEAKTAAARENAKKGGRPKKATDIMEAEKTSGLCQGCYRDPCICRPDDYSCDPG